jgi:hypothetical protein
MHCIKLFTGSKGFAEGKAAHDKPLPSVPLRYHKMEAFYTEVNKFLFLNEA